MVDSRANNIFLGIIYMVVGVTIVAGMNAVAKWLLQHYHVVQVVWARFTGHFLLTVLIFLPRYGPALFRSSRPALAMLRSSSMFASNLFIFSAFALIPLATATAIAMVAPILVTLLAVPLLGERIGWRSVAAAAVGLCGALLIVRPDIDLANWANFLALGAAITYAIYHLLNRQLSDRDSPQTLVVYTALVATVVTTCALPFFFKMPIAPLHILAFVCLGALGALCQFLVIKSFQNAPASVVAPFHYTELLASVALGFAIFGDFPDQLTWAGIGIIVFAGLYLAHRERQRALSALSS